MTALALAAEAAGRCGVTRLAEITGLDDLGVPVFQAIRPLGAALSVHQGKGLSPEAARVGALMEAIESEHAEAVRPCSEPLAWDDLPPDERAPDLADFAADRSAPPDPSRRRFWVAARRLAGEGILWVPFDCVSLDYTRRGDARLDRSSNGLGAGFDDRAAASVALLEVIERDAFHAWMAQPPERRAASRIAADTIPFPWFQAILQRCRARGGRLAVYALATLAGLPAFACEIVEAGGPIAIGTACRSGPIDALTRAVTEAAQARLTRIAGARDDLLHDEAEGPRPGPFGLGLPAPGHLRAVPWSAAADHGAAETPIGPIDLAARLDRAGYPHAAVIDLSRPGWTVKVAKAVVPGLGAFHRRRRAARR